MSSHPGPQPQWGPPPAGGYGPPAVPGGYGNGGQPGWGAGGIPPPRPTAGLAIAALVIGIISLLFSLVPIVGFFSVPFALVAVGLGIAGLVRARAQQGHGRGMSITGIVTGLLALAASVAWFVALVVLAGTAVENLPEVVCQVELRSLRTAVEEFDAQEGRYPESESELVPTFLVSEPDDYDYVAPVGAGQPTYELAPGSSCPPP